MDLGISEKKVLITGAGRGIGADIAMTLAREGCSILISSTTENDLVYVVEHLDGDGHGYLAIDLTREGAPQDLYNHVKDNFGDIDILINNIGGNLGYINPLCSLKEWREVFKLNFEIALELNNLTIPHMRKQKWGRICNISSISALENQGPPPYCASKAALVAYTRSVGRYLCSENVIMNCVLPGPIFTKGGYWDVASKERPEHVEKYLNERMAIKRFGELKEVSEIVAFMCSNHVSFTAGSSFIVDGGQGRVFYDQSQI